MHIRLGTRTSPLALSQSRLIARELQDHHPHITIEIIGIETKADETTGGPFSTQPLAELDGKNFFVKELDDALLTGEIDMTVHSYKDTSIERPEGIVTAAVPPREDPRDVVFFAPHHVTPRGTLTIGSSSPRRQENTPSFLQRLGIEAHICDIRGNVGTRLKRVLEPTEAERYHDGVILALAGVLRLMRDEEHGPDMRVVITQLPALVLPLSACPTAPGQGALAIECHANNTELRKLLTSLHDEHSAAHVATERTILAQHGGGCHQAFGATKTDTLLSVRGRDANGNLLEQFEATSPSDDDKVSTIYNSLLKHPLATTWGIV